MSEGFWFGLVTSIIAAVTTAMGFWIQGRGWRSGVDKNIAETNRLLAEPMQIKAEAAQALSVALTQASDLISKYLSTIDDIQDKLDDLNRRFETERRDNSDKVEALEDEIRQLTKENVILRSDLAKEKNHGISLQKEVDQLKRDLEECRKVSQS